MAKQHDDETESCNGSFRYSAQTAATATATTTTTTTATTTATTNGAGDGDDGAENFFEI